MHAQHLQVEQGSQAGEVILYYSKVFIVYCATHLYYSGTSMKELKSFFSTIHP